MNFSRTYKGAQPPSAQRHDLSPQSKSKGRKARQTRQERNNKTQGLGPFGNARPSAAFLDGDEGDSG